MNSSFLLLLSVESNLKGKNLFLSYQIFSCKSRLSFWKDFVLPGSIQETTKVVPFCENGGKKSGGVSLHLKVLQPLGDGGNTVYIP